MLSELVSVHPSFGLMGSFFDFIDVLNFGLGFFIVSSSFSGCSCRLVCVMLSRYLIYIIHGSVFMLFIKGRLKT